MAAQQRDVNRRYGTTPAVGQSANVFSPRGQRDMAQLTQQHAQVAQDSRMQQAALDSMLQGYQVGPATVEENDAEKSRLSEMEYDTRRENRDRLRQARPPAPRQAKAPDATKASPLPPVSKEAALNPRQRAIYQAHKKRPKQKKA